MEDFWDRWGDLILCIVSDVYLAGTVMLIFAMGLYGLFISNVPRGTPADQDRALLNSSLFGMFTLKLPSAGRLGDQRPKTKEESRGQRPPSSIAIRSPNTSRRMSFGDEAAMEECCCMDLGGMWITNDERFFPIEGIASYVWRSTPPFLEG
eukprot:Gb_37375 [translate_table: standard]